MYMYTWGLGEDINAFFFIYTAVFQLSEPGLSPPTPCSHPTQITLAASPNLLSVVSQSNLQGVTSGVYQQGGDMLLDTRQLNTSRLTGPLYWRLPPQFQGHQVLLPIP